ncbi:MAG TPA: cytochrome c [Anaerolineales bacterium]|nr:cytochrome c [Anaerolineales bacterium]
MKNLLFLLCLGALILASCAGAGTPTAGEAAPLAPVPEEYESMTNPLGPEAATQGAELFQTNCAMCHGAEGQGDGPAGQSLEPPPGNLARVQAEAADDYLYWRIHAGKPGTAMLAWKNILTEEQIWQIVSFIRTFE